MAQQSYAVWLLQAGQTYGWFIIALGAVLTIWAGINALTVSSRRVVLMQVCLSFLPLVIGCYAVAVSAVDFTEIATSATAPKPSEFARIVSLGLACGIFGPVATLIPAGIGLAHLAFLDRRPEQARVA